MGGSIFVIEKNIPIPKRVSGSEAGRRKFMYPLAEMEIGDSFLIPTEDELEKHNYQNNILATARRSKATMRMHFTTRREDVGVRVRRIKAAESTKGPTDA